MKGEAEAGTGGGENFSQGRANQQSSGTERTSESGTPRGSSS